MALFPCPCCGYLVFGEAPGSYDICPVCGWEDDVAQLRFPKTSGANKVSLIEGQRNFERHGASDPRHLPLGRPPRVGEARDVNWRPLDERRDAIEEPVPGMEYGETYPADYTELYYWRSPFGPPAPAEPEG